MTAIVTRKRRTLTRRRRSQRLPSHLPRNGGGEIWPITVNCCPAVGRSVGRRRHSECEGKDRPTPILEIFVISGNSLGIFINKPPLTAERDVGTKVGGRNSIRLLRISFLLPAPNFLRFSEQKRVREKNGERADEISFANYFPSPPCSFPAAHLSLESGDD